MTWSGSGSDADAARCRRTGPLNYLVLIEAVDILPGLFEQILVPAAVCDELAHSDAPVAVRAFIAQRPAWLEVRPNLALGDADVADLDEGERAAIALATSIGADSHGRPSRRCSCSAVWLDRDRHAWSA